MDAGAMARWVSRICLIVAERPAGEVFARNAIVIAAPWRSGYFSAAHGLVNTKLLLHDCWGALSIHLLNPIESI